MATSHKVDVRLGPELAAQVEQFKAESAIDGTSAAVRMLIGLGLEKAGQLDVAWRALSHKEGVVRASAAFKAAYQEAIKRVLSEDTP